MVLLLQFIRISILNVKRAGQNLKHAEGTGESVAALTKSDITEYNQIFSLFFVHRSGKPWPTFSLIQK